MWFCVEDNSRKKRKKMKRRIFPQHSELSLLRMNKFQLPAYLACWKRNRLIFMMKNDRASLGNQLLLSVQSHRRCLTLGIRQPPGFVWLRNFARHFMMSDEYLKHIHTLFSFSSNKFDQWWWPLPPGMLEI